MTQNKNEYEYVDETAVVIETELMTGVKIYKGARVINCNLSDDVAIGDFTVIQDSDFGSNITIQRNNTIYSSSIGNFTYTGRNTHVWNSEIGSFCSISWGVGIGGANHDYSKITTHAFLYSKDFGFIDGEPLYDRFSSECIVGNDVWIGANANICRGVVVGNGAVIGAGAVVTQNVDPYTIVVGVPAKPLKKRFSEEIISRIDKTNWWSLPRSVIKDNIQLFNSQPTEEIVEKIEVLCMIQRTQKEI